MAGKRKTEGTPRNWTGAGFAWPLKGITATPGAWSCYGAISINLTEHRRLIQFLFEENCWLIPTSHPRCPHVLVKTHMNQIMPSGAEKGTKRSLFPFFPCKNKTEFNPTLNRVACHGSAFCVCSCDICLQETYDRSTCIGITNLYSAA